ncbi:MAG: tetratricopeptide repeat protein, partial [Deltaproteobacteria bacterium]|nr:tetratricopeptide repeat protein [Deltaproteobacteria bacterium]
ISAAGADPLVARLSAESLAADPEQAPAAFAHWAMVASSPAERAYASARAAELDAGRAAELWDVVLSLDPGDDYAAAQLRTAHVAAESTQASIDVDLAVARDVERDRARLRAAYGMIAEGQLDGAIDVLAQGRAARPTSLAIAEALGEALAAAGKWTERAKLFAELAQNPGEQLDGEVAQLRSALAWEEAVGASSATASDDPASEALVQATRAALEAWGTVLERDPQSPTAHAAAIVLASRLGDREAFAEVLARAQAAERSPWAAASLGLRRVRLLADHPDGAQRAETILRELQPPDDPRRTVALLLAAARKQDLGEACLALEDRANQLDQRGASTEVAALRLRAAQLALDDGDAPRATRLLQQVETALPHLGVVTDLLSAARRRAGDRPGPGGRNTEAPAGTSTADAFARLVRDADLAASHGDNSAALALYLRALELHPDDPLAALPMVRTAIQLRETDPITSLGLGRLRAAEDAGDGAAKATAYELLAMIDGEIRGEAGSAQIALESASQADSMRIDLMHRLERHYTVTDQVGELMRLRKAELETVPPEHVRDRAAIQLDIAGLATRDGRPEVELADLYRAVITTDPTTRLALLHLEAIVRLGGASEELAQLEDYIAAYFEGDARSQAAFWTRAGETLAEIGKVDEAVQRFGRAENALPGHVPALEGWRHVALKGQLWIDVADAASRQAAVGSDVTQRAALYHFAGVALMDKALAGEQAAIAFRRALEAEPKHHDAFVRLRILLEEEAHHDDLATLLAARLDVEEPGPARVELHRALAELHRNFLSDRDTAKQHYRMVLEADPNDLRAHAALADIAWEQGSWQEAADALMARARLEHQPEILRTLCFRLGLIYADRLVDVPMALKAFQRALTYQPDDENTLVRLADLATQAGEWKLALGACERLVKNEPDPERRAAHLQRVAKIFKDGFGDIKRAERALNLALDGAPTSDDALQALVQFYREANDIASVRVHLNRVAGVMRARAAKDPRDGVAYRVLSRAMQARASTGFAGSRPIARAAAELAQLLGAAEESEQRLLAELGQPDLSLLGKPEADDVLFPRDVQVELRQIFHLLGDRIAKHVGVDLRPYGMTRGDRLRARDNPIASVAQSVATALGFTSEIDVYVSSRQPWAMIAEPTSPVSLVIGASIAGAGGDAIRFAAGGALKLAQASLAIPARLPLDDLGVLVTALLRLFQPDFPGLAVDPDAVATQVQKLRRLIPTGLMNELRPYALAIDSQRFGHRELARDLRITGLRAGLVASGSVVAGLRIIAAQAGDEVNGGELPSFLADPVAQGLISFALSDEHGNVAR